MLPTKQNIATGLDCCSCFTLSSSSICLQFSRRPKYQPAISFSENCVCCSMGLAKWWGLQKLVSRCSGMFICFEHDHSGWDYLLCQSLTQKSACSWVYFSIVFVIFTCILAFQLANVTGITQWLNKKFPSFKKTIQNPQEAESELRSPTGSLPDRLINPDDYEPPFHTPQAHAEPTKGTNETQRRLITPVYTYGSIN